jgi:very-short-patch-repair endonuclease
MRPQNRTIEQELVRLATHHGVVTRVQLLSAGIDSAAIQRRVRKGALIPVYRGVYYVGHRPQSMEARYMAAVRACGEGSVLSGRAAAHLMGLLKAAPELPEVTTPTERRIVGIDTRRSRAMDPLDATTFRGIPVTSVARTLLDLARSLSLDALARACHEAGVRYRTTPKDVDDVLARNPTVAGAANLRRVMHGEVPVVLSQLERRFVSLLRDADLPLPVTNRPASGRRVDCRWPDRRLVVELDSYQFHNSRHAWEKDRERERQARARGDELRRYTWADVVEEPRPMLEELRRLLRRYPCTPGARSSAG